MTFHEKQCTLIVLLVVLPKLLVFSNWLIRLTNSIDIFFSGFRGQNCEENINDCPGHLCQNGATCVDGIKNYTCLCPSTYMGRFCEQDVDECSQRPSVCQNGATCTNSVGGYSCICVNGWTGPDCSININDCADAACFNGATCIDRVGSFYCKCTPGKTGKSKLVHVHLQWYWFKARRHLSTFTYWNVLYGIFSVGQFVLIQLSTCP